MEYKKCLICGKEFGAWENEIKNGKGKYCSKSCFYKSLIGKKRPDRVEWAKEMRKQNPVLKGINNNNWRGDDATYKSKHDWIGKTFGKPCECEMCGDNSKTKRNYHWSNKNHLYKRIREDWQRLCASCHKKYDKQYN
jgi:hypothetical protein